MKRRSFIKISSIGAATLALIPETLISKNKVECNAVIKGDRIFFLKKTDFRVGDYFIMSNGNINSKGIITSFIKETEFFQHFMFFYIQDYPMIEGQCVAITFMRNYNG